MKKFFLSTLGAVSVLSLWLFSCTQKDSEITSIEDLSGKKIGVQSGTTSESYIQKNIQDSFIIEYSTGYDAAKALTAKKIDAIVIDELPAKSIVARNDNLKIIKGNFAEEEYAIAVRKGDKELLDSINKTIASIKKDGRYKLLVNSFISVEGKIQIPNFKEPDTEEKLIMGTNAAFPPFEYMTFESDRIIGFDISLGQIIAGEYGKKLEIVDKSFDLLIPALQTGAIDFIAAGMSATADRKQAVDFSVPYYKSKQVIIVRK